MGISSFRLSNERWHTQHVKDGDHDVDAMEKAIEAAKAVKDKPSVIKLTTTIGFGSKLQGTGGVHGNPLKPDDAKQVKKQLYLTVLILLRIVVSIPIAISLFLKKSTTYITRLPPREPTLRRPGMSYSRSIPRSTRKKQKNLPVFWKRNFPRVGKIVCQSTLRQSRDMT